MLFGQNWEFCLFFSKIGQKKVFCSLLDRRLAILDYKNIDLKSRKFFIVHGFWSTLGNFVLFYFSAKKTKRECFVIL